jgi:hypothetical protein
LLKAVRFGVIERSIGEPICSRRCRRTDARNGTGGVDVLDTHLTTGDVKLAAETR